jgi:hypothetical protein
MRATRILSLFAGVCLAAGAPALAITNGTPDGNAHPYVGFIIGTDSNADNCSGFHQFFSNCSAVLIAQDTVLTTRNCAAIWQDGLNQGIIDELWVIFADDPTSPTVPFSWDCTKFRDIDETQINFDPNIIPNIGVMKLAVPVTDFGPAALPQENAVQNIPRGQNDLTFASMAAVPGQTVLSLRRRSATGRTDPPLTPNFQPVTATTPEGACFGPFTEGGGTFVGTTNVMISIIPGFGGCLNSALFPRLDTPDARAFLGQFVTLP